MIRSSTVHESKLESLLAETVASAQAREANAFDQLAGAESRLVLFGAGGLGRRTLAGLRKAGIEPIAFADNNSQLCGKSVEGIPVLAPAEAASRYGATAVFVITIWGAFSPDHMADRERQLRGHGCKKVLNAGLLFWKFPELFLPHYTMDLPHKVLLEADAVRKSLLLWEDEASREEYMAQLRWRLLLDFDCLPEPVSHPIYFPDDLCRLRADETFVDFGAFDGDTVRSFVERSKGNFQEILAFEPDPENFQKLLSAVAALPKQIQGKIRLRQAAAGARNGTVRFASSGTAASSVGAGDLEVESIALDEIQQAEQPTYIKMDIEGAEYDALLGARAVIGKHAPVLAISAEHRQDDIWRLPLLIHSFNPDYRFFLRPHLLEVWDLVCYAVPVQRLENAKDSL